VPTDLKTSVLKEEVSFEITFRYVSNKILVSPEEQAAI